MNVGIYKALNKLGYKQRVFNLDGKLSHYVKINDTWDGRSEEWLEVDLSLPIKQLVSQFR